MKKPDFKDRQFWVQLRRRTSLDGRVGVEECSLWCNEALELLDEFGAHKFKKIGDTVSERTMRKYRLFVDTHWVLARHYPQGIFIADGTAGQIHKSYSLGYYGYKSNAPQPLLVFYESAIKSLK